MALGKQKDKGQTGIKGFFFFSPGIKVIEGQSLIIMYDFAF